ncbi:DUF6786 family protein [Chitinophaga sp. 22620]|uniref:DUF6786 family protein n=1 Tax=Chitinophaga sp. 22620 TaxID=3453952 RepID=UPI003F838424
MKKFVLYGTLCLAACGPRKQPAQQQPATQPQTISRPENFGADVAFLKEHTETIVLTDSTSKSAIAIVPAWQGRVMTSTTEGDKGRSLGWINHSLIADGKPQPHINAFGGEDRFWLGPEGSQNSFYFAPGDTFDLEHWQVPAAIDTEPFQVTARSRSSVSFERDMQLPNYKGHQFNIKVNRTIILIARRDLRNYLRTDLHRSVHAVGFHSANSITNTGRQKWDTAYGMPSIWILGMFPAAEKNTVMIPVRTGGAVNDDYFGEVPEERLKKEGNIVYFRADANYRSKIGLRQDACYNVLGSYDAANKILTVVQFTMPTAPHKYVNSAWGIQNKPFAGDMVNAYNDGPPDEGKPQLGRFYELESSSPAAALKPGGKLEHYHRTIHLQGSERHLDPIVKKLFGVSLKDVGKAFR